MSITINVSAPAFNAFRFPQLLEWKTRAIRTKYRPACGPDVHTCKQADGAVQGEAPFGWTPSEGKVFLKPLCVSLLLTPQTGMASHYCDCFFDRLSHSLGSEGIDKTGAIGISGSKVGTVGQDLLAWRPRANEA